jgi:hypothetical protein
MNLPLGLEDVSLPLGLPQNNGTAPMGEARTYFGCDTPVTLAFDIAPSGGQRAVVAAKQWMLNGNTKGSGRRAKDEKLSATTLGVKELAKQFRVSNKTIEQARDLLAEAPDLANQVADRSLPLADAYTIFSLDRPRRRGRTPLVAMAMAATAGHSPKDVGALD